MNKDNAKDFLPLVQALADGKVIEYQYRPNLWDRAFEIDTRNAVNLYRVKPEPRTFDMWRNLATGNMITRNNYQANNLAERFDGDFERITVQEVLK